MENADNRPTLKLFGRLTDQSTSCEYCEEEKEPIIGNGTSGSVLCRQVIKAQLFDVQRHSNTNLIEGYWSGVGQEPNDVCFMQVVPASAPMGMLLGAEKVRRDYSNARQWDLPCWHSSRPVCQLLVEWRQWEDPEEQKANIANHNAGLVVASVLRWNCSDTNDVFPGQIWQDKDTRRKGHRFYVHRRASEDSIVCRSLDTNVMRKVALKRLKTEYRLVRDVIVAQASIVGEQYCLAA